MRILRRSELILVGLILGQQSSAVMAADIVPIVSTKSSVVTLSKNQVVDIFLGRITRFPDGSQALPIDQTEGSITRDEFYTTFAGKSSAQVKAHWSKVIFTGRGLPPKALPNSSEIKKFIASNPTAISYIDKSDLDNSIKAVQLAP